MPVVTITDTNARPLPHHWRTCVGGGRVGEALRADFQKHLETTQKELSFGYIRMHGLFFEDMMVYRRTDDGEVFNWQYVDLVFDHWLSQGIRPFVELGFMPHDMASGTHTVFWWKANVTPPREWSDWERLVCRFVRHVIERYGIDEVRKWYFEVWNEPNLKAFWLNADFEAYLNMYETTTRAIKNIDANLRVGGPATSGSGFKPGVPEWGEKFLTACSKRNLPIDFFSTHPYPTFHTFDEKGAGFMQWDSPDRLTRDLDGFNNLLNQLGFGHLERHYTEWSSSPSSRDRIHDTAFMAPFVIQNNLLARGKLESLSFWVISDIFEEDGQGDMPFHGGFGMINIQGLKKPSYHGYRFLSRLGEEELQCGDDYVVTRRKNGDLVVLLWNYVHYSEAGNDSRAFENAGGARVYGLFEEKSARDFRIDLPNQKAAYRVQITRFDRDHGSVFDRWVEMGSPSHLLPADRDALEEASHPSVRVFRLSPGESIPPLQVEPHGVTMLEISPRE